MQNLEIIIKEFNKNLDATSENALINEAMHDLEENNLPLITFHIENIAMTLNSPRKAAMALDIVANASQDELWHYLLTDKGLALKEVRGSMLYLNQILLNSKKTNQILEQIISAHGIEISEATEKHEVYVSNLRAFIKKLIVAKAVELDDAYFLKVPSHTQNFFPATATQTAEKNLTQRRITLNNLPLTHNFLEQTPKVFDEKTLSILPIKDMVLNRCTITLEDVTQKDGIMVISFGDKAETITFYRDKEIMHAWWDHHHICPLTRNTNYIYVPLAKLTAEELSSLTAPSGLLYQGSLDEAQPGSYAKKFFAKARDWTPLMLAVAANDIEEVTKLAETPALDLNVRDHNGNNVFAIAILEGSTAIKPLLNKLFLQDLVKMLPQLSPEACREVCKYVTLHNSDEINTLLAAMTTEQKIAVGAILGEVLLASAIQQHNFVFNKHPQISADNQYIEFDIGTLLEKSTVSSATPFIEILKSIRDLNYRITCKSWVDFDKATMGSELRMRAYVIAAMKGQWRDIMPHAAALHHVLGLSSFWKCMEIFQEIQPILPQIIKNVDNLLEVWGKYETFPQHKFAMIYSYALPLIPNIIHDAKDLSQLLYYLSPEECEEVCVLLQPKLKQFISNVNLYAILSNLSPEQQAAVNKVMLELVPEIAIDSKKLCIRVSADDKQIDHEHLLIAGPQAVIAKLESSALQQEISPYYKTCYAGPNGLKITGWHLYPFELQQMKDGFNNLINFIHHMPQEAVEISPVDQQILEYWSYEACAMEQGESFRSKKDDDIGYSLTNVKTLTKIFSAAHAIAGEYPEVEAVFNFLENSRQVKANSAYVEPPLPYEDELTEFIETFQVKAHNCGMR